MSLVLCSNQFLENSGDFHSAYSFHNHLSDTLTIPANSEIAVQSVKINKNGTLSINKSTVFYIWFNQPLVAGTTELNQTTGYIREVRPHFNIGDDNVLEVTPEELAQRLQIGINNSALNPESNGLNLVSTKIDASGFQGFEFQFKQTSAKGTNISASLTDADFNLVYLEDEVAGTGFTWDQANKRLIAIKSGVGIDKLYNSAVIQKPISLVEGVLRVGLGNANQSSWNVGLARGDPTSLLSPQYYFQNISNEIWRSFDFYDFVVQAGQNGIGSGSNRYIRIYHAVKEPTANGVTMKEIKYYEIVGNPFNDPTIIANRGYNWSANASGIDSVEIVVDNEQLTVNLYAGATKYTALTYDAGADKDKNFKPVSDTCRSLYGKFHLSSNVAGKYLELTDYRGHINQSYSNPKEDFFSQLVLEGQDLSIGLDIDSRFMNNMADPNRYTPLGVSASETLAGYDNRMIVSPSSLYYPSDLSNTALLLGFVNQDVISPTSTSGTINIFTSTDSPPMKSNTSLFVRLNGLGFNSYNAGTGSISKILYSLPRFTNSGESSGNGLFFEPSERLYLPLNNPAPLTLNEFSIDFVNENETLATDLSGKSNVMLHIRPRV